jgi:hypothetical protein
VRTADLVGAITANIYNILIIALFVARLAGRPQLAHGLGLVSIGVVVPLVYLLVAARSTPRPTIYFVWIGLMLLFQIVELLVDYIYKIEFRHDLRMVIPYVMLFFGATGGMIGLAAQAGRFWAGVTSATFLVMAVMAFVQRAKTGL